MRSSGENKINAVKIHNIKTQQTEDIDIDGVFMYVGSQPNTGIFRGGIWEKPSRDICLLMRTWKHPCLEFLPSVTVVDKLSRQVATAVVMEPWFFPQLRNTYRGIKKRAYSSNHIFKLRNNKYLIYNDKRNIYTCICMKME